MELGQSKFPFVLFQIVAYKANDAIDLSRISAATDSNAEDTIAVAGVNSKVVTVLPTVSVVLGTA